jgi:HKD family nuclease
LQLLQNHFEDLLTNRHGQLRFLTGDYLDFTDPVALRALLDLDGEVSARIFETGAGVGFHPKTYICHFRDGSGVAYVGSSNVPQAALQGSVEWKYRVIRSRDEAGFAVAVRITGAGH